MPQENINYSEVPFEKDFAKRDLADFVKNGPTAQELQDAKKFLIGSFALKRESSAKIANLLSVMAFYQLPLDFLDTYQQNINAVTARDIRSVFNEIIGKQKLVTVVVGAGRVSGTYSCAETAPGHSLM